VLVDVTSYTLLQRAAHDEVRTRVFGALEGAAVASGALGAFLGGAVVERVGTDATLFGIGAALLGLALAFWRPLGRIDREAPSLALPAPALS
jgi:predicted MFS family arabinose efflux permease